MGNGVLASKKIGACVLSYGWPCFQKTSGSVCRVNLSVLDGLHRY